jgi:hypothetical protein
MSAVLALTLSVTSAAAHVFHDEAPFVTIVTSTSLQKFELGSSSDYISCKKLELEPSIASEKASQLILSIRKYRECKYTHGGTSEVAEEGVNGCAYELKSALLKEGSPGFFTAGALALECPSMEELRFFAGSCTVEISNQGLSEFQWENQDIVTGKYKSELSFKLKKIAYEIVGTSCSSRASGTNGEYTGLVKLPEIIVE